VRLVVGSAVPAEGVTPVTLRTRVQALLAS
jgi:hypothetical protein